MPVIPLPQPEHTLILAPRGRDALVAKTILREARIQSEICVDVAELLEGLRRGAEVAILTEEAMRDPRPARSRRG